MAKTEKKATQNGSSKSKSKRKRKSNLVLLSEYLPERAQNIEVLSKAVERLESDENVQAALERVRDAYVDLLERARGVEASTKTAAEGRFEELRERLGTLESSLSVRATEELDEMLERIGLVRKARFDSELEEFKRRSRAAAKGAETRRKKAVKAKQAAA